MCKNAEHHSHSHAQSFIHSFIHFSLSLSLSVSCHSLVSGCGGSEETTTRMRKGPQPERDATRQTRGGRRRKQIQMEERECKRIPLFGTNENASINDTKNCDYEFIILAHETNGGVNEKADPYLERLRSRRCEARQGEETAS